MNQSIDYIIGYHCAPTLRNRKAANLVSIPRTMEAEMHRVLLNYNEIYNQVGLYFYELCRCKVRKLLLVFRWDKLNSYVHNPLVIQFLEQFGYHSRMSLWDMLHYLRTRIESLDDFPHEIGIFLGYPLADVRAFIATQGNGYRLCGEWKVYTREEAAKRAFHCFKVCREYCHTQLSNGQSFDSLVVRTA